MMFADRCVIKVACNQIDVGRKESFTNHLNANRQNGKEALNVVDFIS